MCSPPTYEGQHMLKLNGFKRGNSFRLVKRLNSLMLLSRLSFGAPAQMRFIEALRLNSHGIALQQTRYAALTFFRFTRLTAGWTRCRIVLGIAIGFCVGRDETL